MNFISRILADELPFLFACPALLWEVVFLFLPLLVLIVYSFLDYSVQSHAFVITFEYYKQVFNSLYIQVIINSFILAITTAFICLLIAYPVALYLALKVKKQFRTFLLFLLILPSWTSLIIQIYAWFFLLEKNGVVTHILCNLGIISQSTHLLNNYFSIIIGMVSCFLPFMIFPIYSVLEKIDPLLLESSADLGANRFETFKRIVMPLSKPGVYVGLLLVFIPSFGEFAIPSLLGGSKMVFWGNLIVDKFLKSKDWRSGSALACIGILLPLLIIVSSIFIVKLVKKLSSPNNQQRTNKARDVWS